MNIHIGMEKNMVQKKIGGYLENHLRICLVCVMGHNTSSTGNENVPRMYG